MLVDEVVIDRDVITIRGSKLALEHALTADGAPKTGVPTFVREWRARQDSNLRPQA
jgi:site-specific DNA recombinase